MASDEVKIDQFDQWLRDDSVSAALTMRQRLVPVEGNDAVIFPPTYAKPERMRDEEWSGYNIDRFDDKTSVCQIDSVGSQANRMEPIFEREGYKHLVPQITIKAGNREVNLLDAGHRAADAVIRFSDLAPELDKAFQAVGRGNAEPLAKLAPTSIVFGAWDSRRTQVKLPRIVRSVVRAFQVKPMHRSAQYIPAIDYVQEGLLEEPDEKKDKDAVSEMGLGHAPAPWTHGGVQVEGGINREATVNLVALRSLGVGNTAGGDERALALRRYVLGLSLVSVTALQNFSLREGCQLVLDKNAKAEFVEVQYDGSRKSVTISDTLALAYANAAATAFVVGENKTGDFSASTAKKVLGQSKEERKKSRRGKTTEAPQKSQS